MKQPSPQAVRHAAKNKKQLIMLGGLMGLLGVVLIIQFGGGDDDSGGETAAVASPASPTTEATALAKETGAKGSGARDAVAANDVLSGEAEAPQGLTSNPFTNFLADLASDEDDEPDIQELPRPNVTLSGTMPSGSNPIAMIDSRIYHTGDIIQGWTIQDIEPRAVVLKSPTNSTFTLSMPLLDPNSGR